MTQSEDEILDYKDLARFGIKLNTAYSLVSRKQIPHIRLGKRYVKFSKAAIQHWLEECSVPSEYRCAKER